MTNRDIDCAATFTPHPSKPRGLSPCALVLVFAALCLPAGGGLQAQEAAAQQPEYYVVKAGDTLGAIAKRFGISSRDLAQWNDIADPRRLQVGQRLRLAPPGPTAVAARPVPTPPPGSAARALSMPAAGADASAASQKQELEKLRATTATLIELLLSQGIITREQAEEMMQQAQLGTLPPAEQLAARRPSAAAPATAAETPAPGAAAGAAPATAPGTVRVPYVPEIVKNEIRDQIREDVIAQAKAERWAEPSKLPAWLDRLSFYGDLRLRYQGEYFSPDNTPAPEYNALTGQDLANTTQDQELFRYRARLRMHAKLTEAWSGEIGIASGNTLNPVSTNQSMGDYFNRGFITIDRAYIRWSPNEHWAATAGMFANPYFSTDLVWDEDLAFQGAVAQYRPKFNDAVSGFLTAGVYLVEHQSPTTEVPDPQNKLLYGLQAGADWRWSSAARMKVGLAYYPYTNIYGIPNPSLNSQVNNWTAPAFRQKGNTLFNIDADSDPTTNLYALASDFQILNLTGQLDLAYFDPYVVRLTADYAKNLGFDRQKIRQRTGLNLEDRTSAYSLGFVVGKENLDQFGDWQAFFTYKYLQDNSVLDAFNDSDFHLGGTNAKGYIIGGSLALANRVYMRLRWLSATEIDGPPLAIDVLQFDLNARF